MLKSIAILLLGMILLSLASGVIFLFRDSDNQKRVVTSLTIRVILSIALIVVLILGFITGQIQPHGF